VIEKPTFHFECNGPIVLRASARRAGR